ncbi:MAG TPA: hypothetical protein PK648_11410 [Verrucomicrobiales bacterium]|jgi:hypothetical protein|nr:hypothetical protein [Verrucomicrobiales bacterium]
MRRIHDEVVGDAEGGEVAFLVEPEHTLGPLRLGGAVLVLRTATTSY